MRSLLGTSNAHSQAVSNTVGVVHDRKVQRLAKRHGLHVLFHQPGLIEETPCIRFQISQALRTRPCLTIW
jgi:hypothetical protein